MTEDVSYIDDLSLENYLNSLIGKIYKLLPLRESSQGTFPIYLRGLRDELFGFTGVVSKFSYDPSYVSILAILQFLVDSPECPVEDVRREVFSMISLCKRLISKHTN